MARQLEGWRIASATLAAPGALKRALDRLPGALIYPMFMSDGWFTKTTLPQHLQAVGATEITILPPFGQDPRTAELAAEMARTAASSAGYRLGETTLVLAAHGAAKNPAAGRAARRMAKAIAPLAPFGDIRLGFLEEAPFLHRAAQMEAGTPAICLPLFAAGGAHVTRDVPAALRAARWRGPLLAAIGLHARVSALIAGALARATLSPEPPHERSHER